MLVTAHIEYPRGLVASERVIYAELHAEGYIVLRGGAPDFLCLRPPGDLLWVEVKNRENDRLLPQQKTYIESLRAAGLSAEVRWPNGRFEPTSSPGGLSEFINQLQKEVLAGHYGKTLAIKTQEILRREQDLQCQEQIFKEIFDKVQRLVGAVASFAGLSNGLGSYKHFQGMPPYLSSTFLRHLDFALSLLEGAANKRNLGRLENARTLISNCP